MLSVSQRTSFSCSYIMNNILNSCNYKVEATIRSTQDDVSGEGAVDDVILDFDKFKQILRSVVPDKAFLISTASNDPLQDKLRCVLSQVTIRVVDMPFEICTETLCNFLANSLQVALDLSKTNTEVIEFRLRENNDSYATWVKPA